MRVNGFGCSKKQVLKSSFGGEAPRWFVLPDPTDYSIRLILGGMEKGTYSAEISQAATEFDMDMGVYLSPWDP